MEIFVEFWWNFDGISMEKSSPRISRSREKSQQLFSTASPAEGAAAAGEIFGVGK